ncbi:MAG: RsmB/NOP family class I SAM-dependent RNA methyltransferase [Pseudomonadota bacterium]
MTPAARFAAAIEILDEIAGGRAPEPALLAWARGHRFAGSKDRAAIRDIVFSLERRRDSCAAMGGGMSGRSLVLGYLAQEGLEAETVFGADRYAPPPLEQGEQARDWSSLSDTQKADLQPWIWEQLSAEYGDAAGDLAEALRHRAPVWLRVNAATASRDAIISELEADGFAPEASAQCTTALKIKAQERRITQHSLFKEGKVELQDLGPQIAMEALEIEPGMRVLDYCAGGGGKALAAAACGAAVTAHDTNVERMSDLPGRAARAGVNVDMASPKGLYDLVICDVPCSGSGAWRRVPAGKWTLSTDKLAEYVQLQRQIVTEALAFLRPGGTLAYMTCSLLRQENHEQRAYLERELQFLREQQLTPLMDSDGFYFALLEA